MSNPSRPAVVWAAVLLGVTGCAGTGSAAVSGPSVEPGGTSAPPSASAPASSALPPTSRPASSASPTRVATFTNATLAALLANVVVDGEKLGALPSDNVRNTLDNTQETLAILGAASIAPRACGRALIASLEVVNVDLPVAVGGRDVMVQLYDLGDEATAGRVVDAQRPIVTDCARYTSSIKEGGRSVTSTTRVTRGSVTAASVPNAVSARSSFSFDGEPVVTMTTSGSVGPIFIQITDSDARDADRVRLNSVTLEAVGAAVAKTIDQ